MNVQVIADPAGRLVWISPALPGARHDMGAAREHGIIDALNRAEIDTVADTAYQGGAPAIRVPQRRRRLDVDTGRSELRQRGRRPRKIRDLAALASRSGWKAKSNSSRVLWCGSPDSFTTLDDCVRQLRAAEAAGRFAKKLQTYLRPSVLVLGLAAARAAHRPRSRRQDDRCDRR